VDENLAGRIRVSVVATGIDTPVAQSADITLPRGAGNTGPRLVQVANGGTVPLTAPVPVHTTIAQPIPTGATAQVLQFDPTTQQEAAGEIAAPVGEAAEPLRRHAQGHGTLFTDPVREAPAATTAPRNSMFNIFTARKKQPDAEPPRAEPSMTPDREPTALVRQASGEAEPTGLDIPAFLRRQSN
jgi:cell division protein FtsZ